MSRVRPATGPAISLFPFLAVLLCTMGALLVLLVLFTRAAQESETARDQAAQAARAEELQLARDELAWRLAQIKEIRDRTAADLTTARMQLAGAEDDIRSLEDELAALERTALAAAADVPVTADAATLAALEARLAAAQKGLDTARSEKATKRPAYAVVPYEGKHGTGRRPLYIECCIDGVFLQPEGIRLGPADFDGPPGPGNPLASALRAAREHIARTQVTPGSVDVQPYPLLLVRPSGVMAYYAAREAIQSWGSEFGYQFVDEEWELTYPPADPALADAENRAVAESRERLAWLAQVRPSRPQPQPQYRAANTRGGVVPLNGPSVLGDRSRFTWREGSGADGDAAGGGSGDGGREDGGSGGGAGGADLLGASGRGAEGQGGGGTGGGGGPGEGDGRYLGPSKFYAGHGGNPSQPGGLAGTGDNDSEQLGDGPAADGSAGNSGTNGTTGAMQMANAAGAAGGGSAAGSGGAGSASETAGATSRSGSGGGGGSGPSMPGQGQAGGSASASGSLASGRGSNWASLATPDRPIPLTRPIRIECAANEFRLLDETGRRIEARIPIGTRTADAVDPLVQAVHAKVADWGIAGDRMYWKPELVLSETADGQGRRADLERLLADSGLDTRPATATPPVRPLPPVNRTGGMFPRR
jgi:hypothetical protein